MKRIRVILLWATVAVIAISITNVGTYSNFTSSTTSNSNTFQIGTLKVMLNGGAEDAHKILNLDFGKFGAGDSISREFYIKNCGSLPFISKLSFCDENNPLFNYFICEVNIYYKKNPILNELESKENIYNGMLSDFSKSATAISELTPKENLRCEIIFTLPEDIVLTKVVAKPTRTMQATYPLNGSNYNDSISINIDATQVNNASFK